MSGVSEAVQVEGMRHLLRVAVRMLEELYLSQWDIPREAVSRKIGDINLVLHAPDVTMRHLNTDLMTLLYAAMKDVPAMLASYEADRWVKQHQNAHIRDIASQIQAYLDSDATGNQGSQL